MASRHRRELVEIRAQHVADRRRPGIDICFGTRLLPDFSPMLASFVMITFAADTRCLDVTSDNPSFMKASAHVLTTVQWRMHTALQLGRTLTLL